MNVTPSCDAPPSEGTHAPVQFVTAGPAKPDKVATAEFAAVDVAVSCDVVVGYCSGVIGPTPPSLSRSAIVTVRVFASRARSVVAGVGTRS